MFKCPGISCHQAKPKNCIPGPSTIIPTTSNPPTGTTEFPTCGEGWSEINGKCFKHFVDLSNFIVANNKCITRGGTLAVINNFQEQNLTASLHPHTVAWIGAMDWLDEGKFSWVDGTWIHHTRTGTGKSAYSNWKSNQPNNGLINQHCVFQREDGLWDDVTCKREENYICQKLL